MVTTAYSDDSGARCSAGGRQTAVQLSLQCLWNSKLCDICIWPFSYKKSLKFCLIRPSYRSLFLKIVQICYIQPHWHHYLRSSALLKFFHMCHFSLCVALVFYHMSV